MTLLLDTHVWLWMGLSPKSLGQKARALLTDRSNDLVLSAASVWEIVLKCARGKLELPLESTEYVRTRLRRSGTSLLPIALDHVLATASLPPQHADPFDRMIAAQALTEGYILLTADRRILGYPVVAIDVRR